MASGNAFLKISFYVTVLLVLSQQNVLALVHSDLLPLLLDKLHLNRQPVIIILGEDAVLEKDRSLAHVGLSSETSDENGAVHLVHRLLGHDQPKTIPVQHKKSTLSPHEKRQRSRVKRSKQDEEKVLQREDRNAIRSPVVKKLLRMSNSLRCDAKDECQDKCSGKYSGKRIVKCQTQCEIKYECEQEKEKDYEDPCLDDDNGCEPCNGSGDCTMSTKGEKRD